jgi:hypothetical protein
MIVQATIRLETLLVPKPGKHVIYMGEWNPGVVYEIRKCWTNDTFCDLINKELIYCKEILSAPFHELKTAVAEIEVDAMMTELNRDGLFKKYRVIKVPIADEDLQYIMDNKLEGQKVDVDVITLPHEIASNEVAIIHQPTISYKGIPHQYHKALLEILDQATADAFYLGSVSKSTDELYGWFNEKFQNLQ